MDCPGFVFTCILNNASTIYVFGSSAEASGPPYFNFTPVVSQFTTGGANFYNASGVGAFNESVIDGVRSQDEVGVYCQPGATCAVSNYTTYSESLSWNASSIFPEGNTVEGAANGSTNTKNRTFMLVDDGGNVTWNAVGAGSTDTVIQDPTASYSTNEVGTLNLQQYNNAISAGGKWPSMSVLAGQLQNSSYEWNVWAPDIYGATSSASDPGTPQWQCIQNFNNVPGISCP